MADLRERGAASDEGEVPAEEPAGVAAFEHLTGASGGTVTWLGGGDLDVTLLPSCLIKVTPARAGEPRKGMVARLYRSGDTYEIEAIGGHTIWVNGLAVSDRKLAQGDMVEFCDPGPISRFNVYGSNRRVRTTASDIIGDALAYLRVSRRPPVLRAWRAIAQVMRRLCRETTVLYRATIVLAILALGGFAINQVRLNAMFQERLESGSAQLEDMWGAVSRARDEALTPGDLQALRDELGMELTTASERLAALERRSRASARVASESTRSVLFLQGSYGFRERDGGRMLRHVVGDDGSPLISPRGQPLLSLDGEGPVAERQFTGTAFAVGDRGYLVTNRHVAMPWESDATREALEGRGLEPVMTRFVAYRPGRPGSDRVELVLASDEVDLAVLARGDGGEPLAGLAIETTPPAQGEEVIVMGYPTGLRSMLAQAGDAFVKELQDSADTGFWAVAERLAEGGHILPLASRGIVSQASAAALVYDAETTHGGSGGPVLNVNGAVVAVNTAILPEFGGSNLGIPAARIAALLEAAHTQ